MSSLVDTHTTLLKDLRLNMSKPGGDKLDAAMDALENWYDDALKAGMGFKSDEERQQYLSSLGDPEKHPMFARTTEDLEGNPLVEALRAIREEDKTQYELAVMYKDEGNEWMKKTNDKKSLQEAYDRYTHALAFIEKAKAEAGTTGTPLSEVLKLQSQILSNRAASSISTKNYGSCKRDCIAAIAAWPENFKAHSRLCRSLLMLKQYELCHTACLQALQVPPINSPEITALLEKCDAEHEQQRNQKSVSLATTYDTMNANWQRVWQLAHQRDCKVALALPHSMAPEPTQLQTCWPALATMPVEEGSGRKTVTVVTWPLLMLYPQYNQFDIIPDSQIDALLAEYLAMVFPEPEEGDGGSSYPSWDTNKEYRVSNLCVYLQHESAQRHLNKEMITMRAESLATWQRGCLEHQAVAQSLSLDVINYSLRRIAGIPDATASSTTASAADGVEQFESLDAFLAARKSREQLDLETYHKQQQEQKKRQSTKLIGAYDVHLGCSLRRLLTSSLTASTTSKATEDTVAHLLVRGVLSLLVFPRGSVAHTQYLAGLRNDQLVVEELNP